MTTVLATASVQCNDPNTVICNSELRRSEYVGACGWWLSNSQVDRLIVCENSEDYALGEQLRAIASKHGKEFEYLTFMGDTERTFTLGKGFGEGEIIKFALKHSATIDASKNGIYKVTGRLIVKNFDRLDRKIIRTRNYFRLMATRVKRCRQVDTRLFFFQPEFYLDHLLDANERVDDRAGRYLEHEFYDLLMGSSEVFGMPTYPRLEGYSATTGKKYGNQRGSFVRTIANKFRLYNV